MTGEHDEGTASKPNNDDGDAKAATPAANPSPDEEESGDLELIEATPAPALLPVRASKAPPSAEASFSAPRPPPPLPTSTRPSQPHSIPHAQARMAPPPPPLPRPAQTRPAMTGFSASLLSPSPDGTTPAPPAVAGPPLPPAASPPIVLAPLPNPGGTSSRMMVEPAPMPSAVSGNVALQVVPLPAVAAPGPRAIEQERFSSDAAVSDARKRVERAPSGDRAAIARARTELGILLEIARRDPVGALTEYRTAHGFSANLVAPLTAARRLTPLHPAAPALALLEAELRASSDPATRITRQLELGMLLLSSGAAAERVWQAYREVLALRPGHPGALRGLETALATAPRGAEPRVQLEPLAAHLENMATEFRADTRLSAWIEVERGQLLEKLGRADAARAAFEAALALDGQIGPVRDAYTGHLLLQGQIEALIKAWTEEAALETDGARAARLLYAAGRLASERLDLKPLAIDLFERAAGSEAAAAFIRRAALRELFLLYELVGNVEAAVATGTKVLAFARDTETPHWHRRLVQGCEVLGRFAEMAIHARHVLAAEPDDEPMWDKLDQALAALGQHKQRVAMFVDQSSRAPTQTARIGLLLRAAHIAEHDMGRPDVALRSLRAAFAIDPSHADTTDAIVRLLTPGTPPSLTDPNDPSRARARIDFYVEAAAAASDTARRIAHLEKLALIWEDEVRAPDRALAVFREILAHEPSRRGAILGLARCAARSGKARELLRALVLEADLAGDDHFLERSLLLRAADVASKQLADADTALDIVNRVLGRTAGDPEALRAAFRIHERAGRHAEALAQLHLLMGQTRKDQSNYPIQAEIARFLEERMHRTADALTAWREAHRLESSNPTPRAEIRRILLASGDYRALAEELAALGSATTNPTERGEILLEAAEIYDDRLGDSERAIPLLTQARTCMPDEPAIVERLDRAYLRAGKRSERLALLHATESTDPRSQLALASLQAEDRDPTKALKSLADLAHQDATGVAALRVLEHALRRTERWNELDAVLRKQVECFATPEAKLGSAFELVALEEYGHTECPDGQPHARDLLAKLAPDDLLSHELLLRRGGLDFESQTPSEVIEASLGKLAAAAPDPMTRAALHLAAALHIEHRDEGEIQTQKKALLAFVMALEGWPDCLAAARGARRVALRLGETETFVQAAAALGGLEIEPSMRCERLLEAADGYRKRPEDAARAFDLVCRALGEDPNSMQAADAIIASVGQGLDGGKAAETLRSALDRAMAPDQAAKLGAALAHVAIRYLGDQTVALEALRRARKRAPKHVGNLLALVDISSALGLQTETVEAASSALGIARDPVERLRAAVALAEVLARAPAFRDSARRKAFEAEKLAEDAGAGGGDIVARLGAVYRVLGDEADAERVLIQAIALGSADTSALDNLCSLFGTGREAGERVARAITKAMSLAESSDRPRRPEWLAALGKVEATLLGQPREGLARLHEAIRLAPSRVESYQALVEAHGSAHEEATREITGMLGDLGRASPTGEQVTGILSILARTSRQALRMGIASVADELLALLRKPRHGLESGNPSRSQTIPTNAPKPASLAHDTVVSMLLGDAAQTPLLEVASMLCETIAKLVRQDPQPLGVSSRNRLTARASHPARALADRVARAFGDLHFDLYVDASATAIPRLVPGDPPALILPRGFGALSEVAQAAGFAQLLTYVALDIPWAKEATGEDVDGILFGALRVGSELWGRGQLSPNAEMAASTWQGRITKVVGRKVRRALEEAAQDVRPQADTSPWRLAVRVAGLRAAYVATGDLTATLMQASRAEPALAHLSGSDLAAKLFAHPITREVIVFALSDAGLALRRSAGTA
jgi:tetratricopeptide (TPR) repeat protein